MDIEMSGFVHAKTEIRNIGDLRRLLAWCDEHRVSSDVLVDWGSGYVYVLLTGDDASPADWVLCGEHPNSGNHFDLSIAGHACDTEPAQYDWPTKDRLQSQSEKLRTHDEWRYNDMSRPE